ncbi:hypothetical protein IPU70_09240 [Achromobacter sp. SD115]|uniref:condensation domain-containing protein n=1 Tax=Achromobacter sp. SD115 TaxID=2782011 RepID=UPI001A967266|nr:hypothetical protein [Achromobacter sp. SD115]
MESHLCGGLRLSGLLDREALQASLDTVAARHEALRTIFRSDGDGLVEQIVQPVFSIDLAATDLAALPGKERALGEREAARILCDASFDLTRGPLLRVGLIRLSAAEHVLVVPHGNAVGWRRARGRGSSTTARTSWVAIIRCCNYPRIGRGAGANVLDRASL